MPVGPEIGRRLAEAVTGRTSGVLNLADGGPHPAEIGDNLQSGAIQHVVAANLILRKADTPTDYVLVVEAHHQCHPVVRLRTERVREQAGYGQD